MVTNRATRAGFPVIGAIFLALGVIKLLRGDDWVVWLILGVLFGGLGVFSWRKGANKS